jgi:hypothetical protein
MTATDMSFADGTLLQPFGTSSYSSISDHRNAPNSHLNFFRCARKPTAGLSKILAADSSGEFVRFELGDDAATIDNNRSIWCIVNHAGGARRTSQNTVGDLAQLPTIMLPLGNAAKPIAIFAAAGSLLGTARAPYQLRQILVFLDGRPVNKPEIKMAQAQNRFAGGKLTDAATDKLLADPGASLALAVRHARAAAQHAKQPPDAELVSSTMHMVEAHIANWHRGHPHDLTCEQYR